MEVEAVSSDLQALINLYRLLQTSGDSLLSATSVNLDVKAKLHLKNLLDRATEKFFQPPSKIRTAPSTVINNLCSTPCGKSETTTMLHPPAFQDIFKNSPIIKTQSIRDSNYSTIVLPKSENSPEKPMSEGNVLEQSKNSILPTKSESLKKGCRFCQQNSIKQQNLKGGSNTSNDNTQSVKGLEPKKDSSYLVENMDRLGQITNLTGVVKPFTDHSLTEEIDKKLEVVDYLSEEVSEAIKRIKSRFQALRPLAVVVDSLKENNAEDKGSLKRANSLSIADKVHELVEAKEEMVTGNKPGETQGDLNFVKNDLPSYKINRKPIHDHPKNVKAIVGKSEPLSPLKSENDNLSSQIAKYVCGLRVSPSQANKLGQEPNYLAKIPSRVIKENTLHGPIANKKTENLDCTDIVERIRKTQTMKPSLKMNQTKAIGLKPKNNMPHPMNMWPTLLDCKSSEIMVQPSLYDERKTNGTHMNTTSEPPQSKIRGNQISEETGVSSSGSSSSWTSQQTSPSGSESESESVSESHFSGSESRRLGSVSSYSSSRSVESSRGSSLRDHPKKEFKRELRIKPGKQTGRLRRLKNKLGLVFHHHHHHHHHRENDHIEAAHAMSLWTNMSKMFYHNSKNKRKVYDDDDDQSVKNFKKKALVRDAQKSKNQNGHFHALVEGLMRDVRNPKKTKPSKGGIGKIGNGHNKKTVKKKLHWWQILKRERGMKMSNKGRVKIGYTSKNPQSRAPKMR